MAEGAEVAIVDVTDGESLAQELNAKFGRNAGMSVTCDVSDEAAVLRTIALVIERFGKIDILVNNAGPIRAVALAEGHRDRRRYLGQGDGCEFSGVRFSW